jgi:predicted outer membrane repeat protein
MNTEQYWVTFSIRGLVLLTGLLMMITVPARAKPNTPTANAVVQPPCDDAAFYTALNAVQADGNGGTLTFNCGNTPIVFTTQKVIYTNVVIDGGSTVTLSGSNKTSLFKFYVGGPPIALTLKNIVLTGGNSGSGYGGAVNISQDAALLADNVVFENNTSNDQAGSAIFASGNGAITLTHSIVRNNTTNSYGAITSAGPVWINDSVFQGNNSKAGGGAISVSGVVNIVNSAFRLNQSTDGGALYVGNTAVVTVTHSTFEANAGGYGGAIESWGKLQLERGVLSNNAATKGDGGAIWLVGGNATVLSSTLRSNTSSATGGGISCYGDALTLRYSTLSGNTSGSAAESHGGGIYSTCLLVVSNSTLNGNHTPNGGGGGVYQAGTAVSANIGAATIADNTALYGGGVYNDGGSTSNLYLLDTLLSNNATGNCDGVITSQGYNLEDRNTCGALTQPGDGKGQNLSLGPLADNGGPAQTRLPRLGSPALDRIPAAQCTFTTDERGVGRPQNGKCDVGAVERTSSDADYWVYLPLVVK